MQQIGASPNLISSLGIFSARLVYDQEGRIMSQRKMLVTGIIFLGLILAPASAMAQDEPPVSVTPTPAIDCGVVDFNVEITEGTAPYTLYWDFGDGEIETISDVYVSSEPETSHTYPGAGDYVWSLTVVDSAEIEIGVDSGTISLGPSVSLSAGKMPPIFELVAGTVTVDFTAETTGGQPPYLYEWSFVGAAGSTSDPASNLASATYTTGGKFQASVTVTDTCPLSQTDTLTILINDPEDICHPMAKRIATAVSSLFPTQAQDLYTCEDIFAIFEGSLTPGSHFGFGRLWHAYKLSEQIADLKWEEILDWKIDGSGWGVLVQLNRFADALEDVSISELIGYVQNDVYSVKDIRTALRSVLRYDAEFQDALDMLAAGTSPGQMGQYYRLVQDLELDPALLDDLLEDGASLTELRHAAKLAEQSGGDISLVAKAHVAGHSWGEIKQAYRLADENSTVEDILEQTVSEARRQEREEERTMREAEQNIRTAAQIASRYGVEAEDVMGVYEGQCSLDWGCVRAHFRDLARGENGGKPPKEKKDK
jgi:PKD repeat protein